MAVTLFWDLPVTLTSDRADEMAGSPLPTVPLLLTVLACLTDSAEAFTGNTSGVLSKYGAAVEIENRWLGGLRKSGRERPFSQRDRQHTVA